jgi:hypothetical protein
MKFFTLKLYNLLGESIDGEGGLPEFKAAFAQYQAHINKLSGLLEPDLVLFSEPFLIDDALLVSAELSRVLRTLDIVLRCGNLQVGYFDAEIHYGGVHMEPKDEEALTAIAGWTTTRLGEADAYAHEIDLTDDALIEHSMLFHPGIELSVSCQRLTWNRTDRPNRELPNLESRLVVS